MIARLRRLYDIARLIRDLPEVLGVQLELEAEDLKAREDFDERLRAIEQDIKELGEEVADLDAITRELYVGPTSSTEEVRRDA